MDPGRVSAQDDFTGKIDTPPEDAPLPSMRGVLIWGYPLSDVNPDLAGRTAERNLHRDREQKKI